jgi:histidine triad (HIT) family protein
MSDCLFCKIVSKEIPSDRVDEGGDWVAFRDINPQAPTHILIIPRKHFSTVNDIDGESAGVLVEAAKKIAAAEGLSEAGYRLVFNCQAGAGQTVFHVHLHLLGGRPLTWPPG